MPELITRDQWHARYRDGFRSRPLPVTEFWLHHTVTIAPDLEPPFDDDDRAVRTLEQIGQDRFGGGLSYTYPVTPVGRIYEGIGLDRSGAHTKGHNTVGAAFALVGDYTRRAPTAEQEYAIAERMVKDHRAGNATTHHLNGGHRDVFGTSCPGDAAYARIPHINALADRLWADPDYQEDDMSQKDIDEMKATLADIQRQVTVPDLTDFQQNAIGTGQKRWTLGRAIGYLAGQVPTVRRQTQTDASDKVLAELRTLPVATGGVISDEQLERVFRKVFASLGDEADQDGVDR